MFVLTQDSTTIFDVAMFAFISVSEAGEVVLGNGQVSFVLGKYKTVERAKDVVADIFTMLGSVSKYDMPVM